MNLIGRVTWKLHVQSTSGKIIRKDVPATKSTRKRKAHVMLDQYITQDASVSQTTLQQRQQKTQESNVSQTNT
jgi:hypothetical protein